jgi:predicted CopG family antitoxin
MVKNLDIDDAAAEQLEGMAKARGISFSELVREIINEAIRKQLPQLPQGTTSQFRQKVHDFGAHLEAPWTVLADIESEEYVRKYAKK